MSRSHKFISVVLLGLLGLWAAIDQLAQRSRAFDPGPCLGARATEPGCAETAERLVLALAFPNAIPRLEPLRDSGLDIYLTRQQFESVPFPDRETVVRNIGSAWCDHVSLVRLPEVRLRDVRTGEEFGSFGCEFGR
jgi:hypothetical protein